MGGRAHAFGVGCAMRTSGPPGTKMVRGAHPTALLVLLAFCVAVPATAATWTVSPDGPVTSIEAALGQASDGDTVTVRGGTYPGPLLIDKSLTLKGERWPAIDGGGEGTVVSVRAPGVTLEGFVVRDSGASLDQENSGVALEAPGGRLLGNRLENVLFGIYLREASGSVVRGNEISGKELDIPRRGDAIRVWYSNDVEIADNRVQLSRDVVLWYSERLTVRANRVSQGRYGLHFMYCDDAVIEGNELLENSVGAFLMYSRRLRLLRNTIAANHGPSGYGVGLKDMDDATVRENLFAGNRVGVFLDNTPREISSTSLVEGNLFAANDFGILLLPNVRRGRFADNSFVENQQQVGLAGGGDSMANVWDGNHWSDYAGYDADGDGIGDLPHRLERLFEDLTDRKPTLRLFLYSPATQAMDFAARAFPIVKPQPKLIDRRPRMEVLRSPGLPEGARPDARTSGFLSLGGSMVAGALLLFLYPGRRYRPASEDESVDSDDAPHEIDRNETIEVRELSKRFGDTVALDGVSFRIRRGESVAVWGPNGAGKTTALRAILGVMPYDGAVTVDGADTWRQGREARRQMGFVPQEVTFQADLGVTETLDLFARLRRLPAARTEEILALLGLEDQAGKKVRELSGGLRQRLALGVALLADPPILLLDEPTANLDARSRGNFMDLLQTLRERGKTLVFSSHRPEEVLALADRVLVLEDGRLADDDEPRSLYLDRHRDAEIWLRPAAEDLDAAEAALAAEEVACRRLGPHLVVCLEAVRKVLPFNVLAAAGIALEDFELHLSGSSSGGSDV